MAETKSPEREPVDTKDYRGLGRRSHPSRDLRAKTFPIKWENDPHHPAPDRLKKKEVASS